jgi:hypothetical protein
LAAGHDALWSCQCQVTGLATGYDSRGGDQVIWVAAGRDVHAVGPGQDPVVVWSGPRFSRIVRLEAADLDGDGISEWLVVLVANSVRSIVVGMRDGKREALPRPWNGYLRTLVDADGSSLLVGQSGAGDRDFWGPLYRVELSDAGKLSRGERLDLPAGLPLYDFFWLPGSGGEQARLFSVEETDQLAERDARSPKARIWRSDNRIVARPVELEREFRGYFGEVKEQFVRLTAPIEVSDADGDGSYEALLVAGLAKPAVVFENMRFHQGGDVRRLRAGPRGLEETYRSPLMGRAVAAASSWTSPSGRRFLVAAVWTRHRAIFKGPESRLLLLDASSGDLLPASEAAPAPVPEPEPEPEPEVEVEPEVAPEG